MSLIVPSKNEFDNAVNNILSRAEYTHLKNPLKDFINNIKNNLKETLLKWFKKNLSTMDNAYEVSEKLSTVFMIIGLLAILSIIVIIIVKINKTFEKKRKIKEILGERIDNKTTPNSLKQRAIHFKEAGDLRQAIRYDFIALLLLMHEKNLVYLDETKTNEEIFKYLRKSSFNKAEIFKKIADIFNANWYGHKPFDDEGYEDWSNCIELLWNGVIKHEA